MCEMFMDHDGRKVMAITNMTLVVFCAHFILLCFWGTRDP